MRFLLFLFCISINSFGQFSQIEVVILGTFHFGESQDFFQSNYGDITSALKQKELASLRRKLRKYNPDKIFVENTPKSQGFWDQVFLAEKNNSLSPSQEILQNEIYQIAIKLAVEQGKELSTVFCANYLVEEELPYRPGLERYVKEVLANSKSTKDYIQSNSLVKKELDKYMVDYKQWSQLPMQKHLLTMNEEENLQRLFYINDLGRMDRPDAPVGADNAVLAFNRNLKIIRNLYTRLQPSDQRILIIVGAAHAYPLKMLLESHPVFRVKELRKVL